MQRDDMPAINVNSKWVYKKYYKKESKFPFWFTRLTMQ